MTEYDIEYKKYETILEEHNQLMVRIISVTDCILRETLQEEYAIVAQQLSTAESICKSLEPAYLKYIGDALLSEFMDFYDKQFVQDSFENILIKQGLDLAKYIKINRMRPITGLTQKRELTILLNDLHRQLKIIDYQGCDVDIIGKYKDENPLYIRCRGFANVNIDLFYCVSAIM